MKCTIVVLMMALALTNAGQIYRAANLGVVHEAELPEGFPLPIILENLMEAAKLEEPVSAPAPAPTLAPAQAPALAPAPAPAPALMTFKAQTPGAVFEATLPEGFPESIVLENLMEAAKLPEPVSVPAPAPVTFKAETPGAVFEATLPEGFPEPIFLDNTKPAQGLPEYVAPKAPAPGVVIPARSYTPAVFAPSPVFAPAPAFAPAPVVYRSNNYGLVHEAILPPGFSESFIINNLA